MDIKKNITINLSVDDVKQIITEHFVKEGYTVKSNGIKFEVGEECHGYGMGEHYVTEFLGCSVKCEGK